MMINLRKIWHALTNMSALDLRSLAFMRIALGSVLLFDLTQYASLATFYLADSGFANRVEFLSKQANAWNWSLLYTSGSDIFIYLFLTWHAVTLLLFVIGYKTRWQTFFLWVQIVSLHNRNWTVTNGGDDLIRCCLLLLVFLPLGARWSWDSKNKSNNDERYHSLMNFVLFVQISIMYIASALLKNHPWWNVDFSAMHYVLNLDLFVRPFGVWLKNFPSLISPLTAGAYYFEIYGPYILFLGFFTTCWNFSRYFLVISFVAFHLAIDCMLNVGTFPYFAMALWTAFLPSHFWNSLKPQLHAVQEFFTKIYHHLTTFIKPIHLPKFSHSILAAFFLFNLLYWPLSDSKIGLWPATSNIFFQTTNRWLATYQNWYLFAPYPKVDNVWYEIIGELSSKNEVDLFRLIPRQHPINAEEVHQYYHIEKWRKILLKMETTPLYQNWLAQYYCKHWHEIAGKKFSNDTLMTVKILSHNLITAPRGIASGQRSENVIISHNCSN